MTGALDPGPVGPGAQGPDRTEAQEGPGGPYGAMGGREAPGQLLQLLGPIHGVTRTLTTRINLPSPSESPPGPRWAAGLV